MDLLAMDLADIEAALSAHDFQYRLKALRALKAYPAEVAVPLILSRLRDPEFLVRTFVARELGSQQTAESFAALLELLKLDNTPNVRAEAANSLSLFGAVSASYLVQAFVQDDHWLVRRSILAAAVELDCPTELWEICQEGIRAEDAGVQETSVDALGMLAHSPLQQDALGQLLTLAKADSARVRSRAAYALKSFTHHADAKATLETLRQDRDHQVVAAALENLLP
jgi:HEAT repeat protein